MLKKPTEKQVHFGATVLGIIAMLGTVGGAIVTWQKLIPYITELELRETERRLMTLHEQNAARDIENARDDRKEQVERCNNTIARLESDLFRAGQNQFEAEQLGNRTFVDQAKRSQLEYNRQIDEERRECGFNEQR